MQLFVGQYLCAAPPFVFLGDQFLVKNDSSIAHDHYLTGNVVGNSLR